MVRSLSSTKTPNHRWSKWVSHSNVYYDIFCVGQLLPASSKENITFSNTRDKINVNTAIKRDAGDCNISFNFSRCPDPSIGAEKYVNFSSESDITIQIDNVEIFYGHNITVTMDYNCDDISKRFYIPHINQTG